jgi:tetratricopeptide (TPR) repeat protein
MKWDCKLSSIVAELEIRNKKKLLSISIILITILIGSIIIILFNIDDALASVCPVGKTCVKKQVPDALCSEPDDEKEKSDSKAAVRFNYKGIDFANRGQHQKAIQYFDLSIEEDPNSAAPYFNKGNALYALKKYQEAIESYDKALDEDSNDAKALYGKGAALSSLGKYEEAIEYYDQAVDEEPDFAQALKAIGSALYNLGKYQEAIEYYEQAIDEDPNCKAALKWKNIAQDKLDNKINVATTKGEKVVKKVPIKRSLSSSSTTTAFASGGGGNMTPASSTTDFAVGGGGGNMTPASPLPPIVDDNTPPVSSGSSITTTTDKSIDTQLFASDQDNDELTASIVSAPFNGILSDINQENGMVTYTPNSGFTGTDHFSFKVNDGKADSNSAQITVTISQENKPPSAHGTTVTTNMDTPIDITLPASDPDPNDELTASIVSAPFNGILSDINQENGMVTYTPNTEFSSSDTFTFKVNDGKVDSNPGIIKIAVSTGYQDDCKEVPTQVTEYPPIKDSNSATTTNSKALLQNMKNCDPITSITPTPTTTDNNNNIVPPLTSIGDVSIGGGGSGGDLVSGATTPTKGGANTPVTNPTTKLDAGANKGVVGVPDSDNSYKPPPKVQCKDGYKQIGDKCHKLIPIIFLPGVAGSKIFQKTENGNRMEVWPSVGYDKDSKDKLPPLTGMDLKKDGETFVNVNSDDLEVEIFKGAGPYEIYDFYKEILTYLEDNHGYKENRNLFIFPYNWLLDNAKHFDKLDKLIKKTDSPKVILIAHSMGGLISKGYILSNYEGKKKVEALITIGTPYGGAPKAFHALVDGYNFENPAVKNNKVVKAIAQNAPAPYQLLPREPFITDINNGHSKITLIESYTSIFYRSVINEKNENNVNEWTTENNVNEWTMNSILLDKANQFWSSFGPLQDPRTIPVKNYVIVGVGTCTLAGYNMKNVDASLSEKVKKIDWAIDNLLFGKTYSGTSSRTVTLLPIFADGDKTVPLWSSNIKGSTQTFFVKEKGGLVGGIRDSADHGSLPGNTNVRTIVGNILNNINFGSTSPLDPDGKYNPKMYTPMKCPQTSESILPSIYKLDFSGFKTDNSVKLNGETSGTALLSPDGNVINGKGKFEMKASHAAQEQGKLCEYEYKTKDPDYYEFKGKWKLDPSKTKQNPHGIIILDLDSEIKFIDLKRGPQSCKPTYRQGYELLLACEGKVDIDIASKEGGISYYNNKCKFKIS